MAGDYHISTQYITVMAQLTLINGFLTPITKLLYHEIIECATGFRAITMIVFHFNEPTHAPPGPAPSATHSSWPQRSPPKAGLASFGDFTGETCGISRCEKLVVDPS